MKGLKECLYSDKGLQLEMPWNVSNSAFYILFGGVSSTCIFSIFHISTFNTWCLGSRHIMHKVMSVLWWRASAQNVSNFPSHHFTTVCHLFHISWLTFNTIYMQHHITECKCLYSDEGRQLETSVIPLLASLPFWQNWQSAVIFFIHVYITLSTQHRITK